jgi:hypothetical protein
VRKTIIVSSVLLILFTVFLHVPNTAAQQRKVPQEQILRALIRLEQKLSPEERDFLSGSLSNWLAFAHSVLDKPAAGPDDDGSRPPFTISGTRSAAHPASANGQSPTQNHEGEKDAGAGQVSNSSFDVQFSRLTGFTQSTSSSAWCGHNIVTGFNSTTASVITGVLPFLENANNPSFFGPSLSNVGVAFSSDDGESFTDPGFLNPGPTTNTTTAMGGNPSVVCATPERFYYVTSPFSTFINDPVNFTGQLFGGAGLSISSDGGRKWADPVAAVSKDQNHLLDQARIAVDPHDRSRLYVTYIDLDLDGVFQDTAATARCPNTIRHAIEIITSVNGGQTWSSPSVVREDCDPLDSRGFIRPGIVQVGPQLAVGPDGNVFVSYLVFGTDGSIQLSFRRSKDRSASFGEEVQVSNIVLTGDPAGNFGGVLQGFFANLQLPSMAVDPVKHNGKDTIYIAWSDGRDNPQIDVVTITGTYNFSDILIVKSTDDGSTWTAPKPVSPTPEDFAGIGRDQFQPAIAVNRDSTLAVCYYDRRNDPQNNAVDHFCSISRNGGRSFHDIRQTATSWIPVHGTDLFLNRFYLGQYDTVATHFGANDDDSFFSSFQVIRNVVPSVHGRSLQSEQ